MNHPIVSCDNNQDERGNNVHLLEHDADCKTTAEDYGDCWMIRDWELHTGPDSNFFWFERSGYSIGKDIIARLAKLEQTA